MTAADNKVNQHLSICHELLDAGVDFLITAVTGFHLLQLTRRTCARIYQIIDNSFCKTFG